MNLFMIIHKFKATKNEEGIFHTARTHTHARAPAYTQHLVSDTNKIFGELFNGFACRRSDRVFAFENSDKYS